jgi:hypothetical protein
MSVSEHLSKVPDKKRESNPKLPFLQEHEMTVVSFINERLST